MSMFENGHYRWRETYFVLFKSQQRPLLALVEQTLSALNEHYVLTNLSDDDSGRFESLTLLSPEDFAALDICYTGGVEVLEQGATLAEEMEPVACETGETETLNRLKECDGRFDILHFEQLPDDEEEGDEMLDPGALLLVLEALARISDGIAIDPQGGTFMSETG